MFLRMKPLLKSVFSIIIFTLLNLSLIPASPASQIHPQKITDVCEEQGVRILQNKFGHQYSVTTSGHSIDASSKEQYYSFAIPQLCHGDFYLRLGPGLTTSSCTNAHSGQIQRKFVTLSAFGDCRRWVPDIETVDSYY